MYLSQYRHEKCSPNLVSVAKHQGVAHRLNEISFEIFDPS